ncbi:unnamed protein product [Amaranthus hypochondriacus]
MKGTSTSPLIIKNDDKSSHKTEEDEDEDGFLKIRKGIQNHNTATVGCMTFYSHRRHSRKSGSSGKKEQKSKEAIAGRKHKENRDSENLFDNKSFKRFYQSKTNSEDVAQMLAPIWAPPLEMMAVGWLGDWRPSSILELLRLLASSSYLSPSSADSAETDRIIAQLIHEIRIEETIIDEEMTEIQANCILHLPLRPPTNCATTSFNDTGDHDCVQFELKKIKQVVTKAQQLRYKVLELVSNKVLNEVEAGKFLVAFSGIQDIVHKFAANQKLQKGPVSVSIKALTTFE